MSFEDFSTFSLYKVYGVLVSKNLTLFSYNFILSYCGVLIYASYIYGKRQIQKRSLRILLTKGQDRINQPVQKIRRTLQTLYAYFEYVLQEKDGCVL